MLKDMLGFAAFSIAASFVGLCMYFEQKRRKDNQHENLLKAEALRFFTHERKLALEHDNEVSDSSLDNRFLHNIQMGEANIVCGNIEDGIKNLTEAVCMCERPVRLLQALQQIFDEHTFAKLMLSVEEKRQLLHEEMESSILMKEDDVDFKNIEIKQEMLEKITGNTSRSIDYKYYEECS